MSKNPILNRWIWVTVVTFVAAVIIMYAAVSAQADDLCDYDAYNLYKYQKVRPLEKPYNIPTSDMFFMLEGRGFTLKGDYQVRFPVGMNWCEWYEDQQIFNDWFTQPVIAYSMTQFLINSTQEHYWFGLTTAYEHKYRFRNIEFEGKFLQGQSKLYIKHMKEAGIVPVNAVYDMVLTVKKEHEEGWRALRRLSEILKAIEEYTNEPQDRTAWLYRAFLTPHMLDYVWADSDGAMYDPVVEEKARVKRIALPAQLKAWRDSGTVEGKLFLAAAYRVMDGVDPWEYIRSHGYIPADRSTKDMQYNYALRSSNKTILARNHKVEPAGYDYIDKPPRVPKEPLTGYTYETKSLYYEERRNAIADDISANQLVDQYLGIENDYPDINATIMNNLLADYGMLDDNPYEGVDNE
jgi:hypothetical protein